MRGKPIRLGLIAELSGGLAFYGSETNRAAVVMVKEINASGGLLGRPVELITRDSKGRRWLSYVEGERGYFGGVAARVKQERQVCARCAGEATPWVVTDSRNIV